MNKSDIRKQLRARRSAITAKYAAYAAERVMSQLLQLRLFRPGKKVAFYLPMASEFPILPAMLAALKNGCHVYAPRVLNNSRQLCFARINAATRWIEGAYAIQEPVHDEVIVAKDLDVVLLPLVGFNSDLYRLGQGGGFYDTSFFFRRQRRFWKKPLLVGVSFACQQHEQLPVDPWDLQMDVLVTEQEVLRRR